MPRRRSVQGHSYIMSDLANSGRIAGDGVLHDDYSEESMSGQNRYENVFNGYDVKFPHDGMTLEERDAMNGPVITYKVE